jgi:hypothetical protein
MAGSVSNRKQRRSFSLSSESIRYVERVRKQKRSPSASSALEEIIRENMRAREEEELESAVYQYYDSVSSRERGEQNAWGAFSETQISEDR